MVLGLGWAPFWFGGDRPLAWGVNAIVFGALVVALELYELATGSSHPVALRRIWLSALGLAVVVAWTLIQMSPWVPASFQHPIWRLAEEQLGQPVPGSISVNRDATALALVRLLTNASAFWLAIQVCRSRQRSVWLVQAVAMIGLAYAIYGLIAFLMFPGSILWFTKVAYPESLTSTFVNRNSYATYAAIGLVCAFALVLRSFSAVEQQSTAWRQAAAVLVAFNGAGGFWLATTLVVGAAFMLTGSRAGILCGLAGVVTIAILAVVRRKQSANHGEVAIAIAVLALGAIGLSYGETFASRISDFGLRLDDRLLVDKMVLIAIADHPVLGFGFGTFEHVFPMYRDASISPFGRWDKVHNDYLEAVIGFGVPIAAVFMCGLALLVGRCFWGVVSRRHYNTAGAAATAVSVVVLAHAAVDFSLQMPGVSLTFAAVLGAGVAQSWSRRTDTAT